MSTSIDYLNIPFPSYVCQEELLENNLKILDFIQQKSGAKILLALKGFALWRSFKLISKYLSGTTASGIYEARLGYEEFGGFEDGFEVAVFSPAYRDGEIESLLDISTHIIFNSFAQWQKYKNRIEEKNRELKEGIKNRAISVGLRVNPLYSEVMPEIYNPCIEGSRLGITPSEFEKGVREFGIEGIEGLHFHTHCEQNSDALERTIPHFERYFGLYADNMRWINFGGGHHITREDYDTQKLINIIKDFKNRHGGIEIFLEPGEAIGWRCGFLIGSVLDIVNNGIDVAIVDVSAAAHMPDCLEMPYVPAIRKIDSISGEGETGINIEGNGSDGKIEGSGKYIYQIGRAHV